MYQNSVYLIVCGGGGQDLDLETKVIKSASNIKYLGVIITSDCESH